jgi:GTPase SAR1 family protein
MATRYTVPVVGVAGSGKTFLISALRGGAGGQPHSTYVPSKGVEQCKHTVVVDGEPVCLEIVDTPGQQRFKSLCDGWVAQAHAVVVVIEVLVRRAGLLTQGGGGGAGGAGGAGGPPGPLGLTIP